MTITEKEAMEKWCPFPGMSGAPGYVPKKDIMDKCIASACMAWRKDWRTTNAPADEQRGFCGLAGTPAVA